MSYTAPVKDMLFAIEHLANIEQIAQIPGFEDAGLDTAAAVLGECAKFNEGVLAPLNWEGDKNPSSWKDGVVTTTPGFKEAFRQYAEGGWQGLQHPADFGGQGLPKTIGAACIEMTNSANMSFALCPLLTDGAIEALLTAPSDAEDGREGRGAVAADRMAILVTASWPRGELTTLSYRHSPGTPDRLSIELDQVSINSERARWVATALESGRSLNLSSPSDRAAASRMQALVVQPKRTLGDVNHHMRTAFRRLYRQRNILMHGGTTGSIALPTALRAAAPLIGAGLDRLTHAALSDDVGALQLAARAQLNIDLLGGADARHLVDLLEP